MSFLHPAALVVAALVTVLAVAGYVLLAQRRRTTMAATGLTLTGSARGAAIRRHLPYTLMLVALPLLLTGLARPQAEIQIPRVAGTVVLVFDVSNSMTATDVAPSRLAAAQAAATSFVEEQPDTVDIGVVVFGDQALTTQAPTDDRGLALAAIDRLAGTGGTSLGQAILASLSTITGQPVQLPETEDQAQSANLGYWPSATIVLFSDGEDTTGDGSGAEAASVLAANAGIRINTVGVGTAQGGTVEVDGYQLSTALDEELLRGIADVTGGSYHQAGDTAALTETTRSIDLRLTSRQEPVELTAPLAAVALLLLVAGALLSARWQGRIV